MESLLSLYIGSLSGTACNSYLTRLSNRDFSIDPQVPLRDV